MPAAPAPLEPQQKRSQETRQRLLDAAVDELLEAGYAGLTTTAVAQRARVSRGAQQHHFPHKKLLVAAAVRHLAERQIEELREQAEAVPEGRRRFESMLDRLYSQYGGPLFAAMLELSLSSRHDLELREVVAAEEAAISRELQAVGHSLGGGAAGFDSAWRIAVSTVRGFAMLIVLGHPATSVDQQWPATRERLTELLSQA